MQLKRETGDSLARLRCKTEQAQNGTDQFYVKSEELAACKYALNYLWIKFSLQYTLCFLLNTRPRNFFIRTQNHRRLQFACLHIIKPIEKARKTKVKQQFVSTAQW